jgi:hypothetical protein
MPHSLYLHRQMRLFALLVCTLQTWGLLARHGPSYVGAGAQQCIAVLGGVGQTGGRVPGRLCRGGAGAGPPALRADGQQPVHLPLLLVCRCMTLLSCGGQPFARPLWKGGVPAVHLATTVIRSYLCRKAMTYICTLQLAYQAHRGVLSFCGARQVCVRTQLSGSAWQTAGATARRRAAMMPSAMNAPAAASPARRQPTARLCARLLCTVAGTTAQRRCGLGLQPP